MHLVIHGMLATRGYAGDSIKMVSRYKFDIDWCTWLCSMCIICAFPGSCSQTFAVYLFVYYNLYNVALFPDSCYMVTIKKKVNNFSSKFDTAVGIYMPSFTLNKHCVLNKFAAMWLNDTCLIQIILVIFWWLIHDTSSGLYDVAIPLSVFCLSTCQFAITMTF